MSRRTSVRSIIHKVWGNYARLAIHGYPRRGGGKNGGNAGDLLGPWWRYALPPAVGRYRYRCTWYPCSRRARIPRSRLAVRCLRGDEIVAVVSRHFASASNRLFPPLPLPPLPRRFFSLRLSPWVSNYKFLMVAGTTRSRCSRSMARDHSRAPADPRGRLLFHDLCEMSRFASFSRLNLEDTSIALDVF